MNKSKISGISDTAFWVSAYRAEESKRSDALFQDPFAELLAGEKGKNIATNISGSRYAAWTVIIRTRVIDEMIESLIRSGIDMVVNLGAGLDTRPYRLNLPKSLQWIEVDYSHMMAFKEEKMKNESPRCHLERIGVDLSDQKRRQNLFEDLNSRQLKTVVLTEGVIPYLNEEQVSSLAVDLHKSSNFLYWITEYHSTEMYRHLRNRKKEKEMENSPFQFFPNDWLGFFNTLGWRQKELLFLGEEGAKWNRPFPLPWWAKALFTLLPKKEFEKTKKMSGFILLKPHGDLLKS